MVKNICINGVNYCSAKNNVKIAFNIAIVLCVMITSVFVPSTSLQAQDLGLVQSYAKGFAITADDIGLEAAMKNPANVLFVEDRKALVNLNESYSMDIYHGFFAVGYQLDPSVRLSISFPVTQVNNILETQQTAGGAEQIGTFSSTSLQPTITVNKQWNKQLSVGVNAVFLIDNVYNETASGYSVDMGLLYKRARYSLGASLQHLGWAKQWSTGRNEVKPLQLNVGYKLMLNKSIAFLSDISIIENERELNVGTTINMLSALDIYVGIRDLGNENQYRAGVGFHLMSTNLQYSFGYHSELGNSHKFGLSFDY